MNKDDPNRPPLQRILNMSKEEIDAFRDLVLNDLNVDLARKMFPMITNEESLLGAMHKARYELTHFPDHKRHASRKWLEDHGMTRWKQQPWPEKGLPR